MPRLRMLTTLAGHPKVHNPGDEVDFNEATAKRLIAAGFAEPVKGLKAKRTADAPDAKPAEVSIDPNA
ncbi:MAG: hypothetical protein AAF561_00105 [Planctomycetota bacterium]